MPAWVSVFCCGISVFAYLRHLNVIKEVRKTTGTRNLQHNRTAPKHYIYKDKGFAQNKKHIVMCNASYLYNYIEISHNSLISFFSLLTTVITVK